MNTLWYVYLHMAMETGTFSPVLPSKHGDFPYSYVLIPKGSRICQSFDDFGSSQLFANQ